MSLMRFNGMLIKTRFNGNLCPVLFGVTSSDDCTLLTYTCNLVTMKQTFDVPQTKRVREIVRKTIPSPENVIKYLIKDW